MTIPKINAFPTYWENGMKLGAAHFQHLEESIEDNVRDGRMLAGLAMQSYGLLPNSALSLQGSQGNAPNSVRVIVNSCRAILPGGYRVEILPENVRQVQLPSAFPYVEFIPSPGVNYHLYLSVDENNRVPAGIPETRPIRHPYLVPDYRVEVIPAQDAARMQRSASNQLKIAEWKDGKISEHYIPACISTGGHQTLNGWHQWLLNQLEQICRVAIQVIHEHRLKDQPRAAFCQPIITHIRSKLGYFKYVLPQLSPLHLIAYYADLAGLVQCIIETGNRDFTLNFLQNGRTNNLLPAIQQLLAPEKINPEEILTSLILVKQFGESLFITIKMMNERASRGPGGGDQR
ncbi:MAG: hypothetical protein AAF828_08175 [Bacteroidota bacterium]